MQPPVHFFILLHLAARGPAIRGVVDAVDCGRAAQCGRAVTTVPIGDIMLKFAIQKKSRHNIYVRCSNCPVTIDHWKIATAYQGAR